MYYRTDDFRFNLMLGSILIFGALDEGRNLVEDDTLSKTMIVGLASIASLGQFVMFTQVGIMKVVEVSSTNIKLSFELLTILYTATGLVLHLIFYKMMLDKGLPLTYGEPLLRNYLFFCFLTALVPQIYQWVVPERKNVLSHKKFS